MASGRACCFLVFRGPDAVEKIHRTSTYRARATAAKRFATRSGDYITMASGKVTYFEPGRWGVRGQSVERDLKLWAGIFPMSMVDFSISGDHFPNNRKDREDARSD